MGRLEVVYVEPNTDTRVAIFVELPNVSCGELIVWSKAEMYIDAVRPVDKPDKIFDPPENCVGDRSRLESNALDERCEYGLPL